MATSCACGESNRDGATFCRHCGRRLNAAGAPEPFRSATGVVTMPVRLPPPDGTSLELGGAQQSGVAPGDCDWRVDRRAAAGQRRDGRRLPRAHHQTLGIPAALKVLSLRSDDAFRERFRQEALTQATLRHPHIGRILNYIEHGGEPYLAIEYLSGGTLADAVKAQQGPLDIGRAVTLIRQALSGLGYAHQHGIIHRDVTASNIMLDHLGAAKVTDFGIALRVGTPRLTRGAATLGTLRYMSPEQIRQPHAIDARSDLYSMGVVLYELLTGVGPFAGEREDSDFAVMDAHVRASPAPPRSLNPSIPEAVERGYPDRSGQGARPAPCERGSHGCSARRRRRALACAGERRRAATRRGAARPPHRPDPIAADAAAANWLRVGSSTPASPDYAEPKPLGIKAEFLTADQRCACMLVLDTSGSMQGQPIDHLNQGLRAFEKQLKANPLAARRIDVAIVTFGNGGVHLTQDFAPARHFTAPALSANGSTPMGEAVTLGLQHVRNRKNEDPLSASSTYRPWLLLITDGEPTDEAWEMAAGAVRREESQKGLTCFPIGVGSQVNMQKLRQFSSKQPVYLNGLDFEELFVWLSGSLGKISASGPGD